MSELGILVVDDSPHLRTIVKEIVKRRADGWRVIADADNGASGIDQARSVQPDLVLLDISMPVMDGLEALPGIRAAAPRAVIVILTGYPDRAAHDQALAAGADGFIEKDDIVHRLVPDLEAIVTARRPTGNGKAARATSVPGAAAGPTQVGPAGKDALPFHYALDYLPDPVFLFEPRRDGAGQVTDLDYRFVNRAGARLLDKPADEIVGHTQLELFPAVAGSELWHRYLRVIETGEPDTIELRGFKENGVIGDFDINAAPFGSGLILTVRDVTDRVRLERRLRYERDLNRATLDAAGALIVIIDFDWRILRFNRYCEQVTGYTEEEVLGKSVELLIPESERLAVLGKVAVTRPGHTVEQVNHWRTKDGELRVIRWSNTAVVDEAEMRMIAIGVDITDQARAEQDVATRAAELQALNTRYQLMLDTSLEGVLTNDADDRVSYVNDRAASMLRRSREELIGMPVLDLVTPESRAAAERELAGRRAGRSAEYERSFLRGDGSTMFAIVNGNPLYDADGNYAGALAMVTDITDRKQAEKALATSETRLRTAFDALMEGLALYRPVRDDDGRIVDFWTDDINAAGCRLTNMTREQFVGHRLGEIRPWFREGDLLERWAATFESGEPYTIDALPVEGEWAPGLRETRLFAIHLQRSGEQLVEVWREVTEEVQARAAEQAHAEQLARANRDLDAFASALSHDLREPLRSTAGFLQLIDAQNRQDLTPDARTFLDYALDGTERMNQRITAILDFARSGNAAAAAHPVEAGAAVRTALRDVDDLLTETGAQVEIGELPVVLADDVQLQRVFQNLISNAARYHRAGVPPQISVRAAPAGGRWLFTVADNGPGVPERMRERIFKMFNRGDADPEVAGHGMGLALCRRIIDSYDGRIWVEPNPGGGSRICFTLPAARGRADGPKAG